MKLPIPYEFDGDVITEFEVKEVMASSVADTRKIADKSGTYAAMRKFAEETTLSLNGNEERQYVLNAIKEMPFQSVFAIVVYGIAETRGFDSVSGAYECPKCHQVRMYEKTEDDDLSDHLYNLNIDVATDTQIVFDLPTIVEIHRKDTGEVVQSVHQITMRYPTINEYIKAEQRYPDDPTRLLFFVYGCALTHVDGREISQAFRSQWGELVFSHMTIKTINKLSDIAQGHIIGSNIERVCMKCHNRWKTQLDLLGFFSSGLQG